MAQFDHYDDFKKSGLRRLRDAEELLEKPTLLPNEAGADSRHAAGARYLSGYAVECLLKAYLIAQVISKKDDRRLSVACDRINVRRIRKGEAKIRNISSAAGHDISYLLGLTKLEIGLDEQRRLQFDLCARWRSDWRYDSRFVSREDAIDFVEAVRNLVDWLLPQV